MKELIGKTTLSRFSQNHLLFLLTVGMTLIFLMTGSMKVMTKGMMVAAFDGYGLPIAFMIFIGYAEIFGALSLWLKRWALLGSLGLSVILFGASSIHYFNQDPIHIARLAYIMTPVMIVITIYHWRAEIKEGKT